MAFENFKKKKFSEIIAQATTRGRDPYRKIPAILRLGKKATEQKGFFDYNGIIQESIDKNKSSDKYEDNAVILQEDPITKEVSILIKDTVFRNNFFKHIDQTLGFSTQAKTEISKSFFTQIGTAVNTMPAGERYISILSVPFEEPIGTVTASISVTEAPGIAYNPDGSLRNRKITYQNTSSFFTNSHFFFNFDNLTNNSDFGDADQILATNKLVAAGLSHTTRSFKAHTNVDSKNKFYYVQATPIKQFSIEMSSSNNTASFFALTSSFSGSADFGVTSGSFMGKIIESSSIQPRFYNGTKPNGTGDDTDGSYIFSVQKGIIEGEGEFAFGEDNYAGDVGSNVAFTPQQMVVWYPPQYNYSNVRSASFYFTPYPENMHDLPTGITTKNLVTHSISSSEVEGTGELRRLYWLNHTYTSSFTSSFGHLNRGQLRNDIGGVSEHFQLPYMNQSIRRFGKKNSDANASHLWKDSALSQPVDQGYYVHSSSFTQESKNQMSASINSGPGGLNNANHTSSFFVMGVFKHPFTQLVDSAIMNYTASQEKETGVTSQTFMTHHPIASCMFLKRYDGEVFQYQPQNGQAVISESVG